MTVHDLHAEHHVEQADGAPGDAMRHAEDHHAHAGHEQPGHGGHAGHGTHAGHHVEMFRRRFWVSLALTVPVVATSHMVMDWFGYELEFAGMDWIGPILGSVIFLWGGWPF